MPKERHGRTAKRPYSASKRRQAGTQKHHPTKRNRTRVNILIVRSSGRVEKFDSEKMAQVVSRSGTPYMLAKDVARKISSRIRRDSRNLTRQVESNKHPVSTGGRQAPRTIRIESADVRRMVAEELRSRNRPEIASSLEGERPVNVLAGRGKLDRSKDPLSDSEAANKSKLLYDNSTPFAKSTKPSSMR